MPFPDHIQIPAVTAAGLRFEGDLTARDQSILLLVGWYAAMHGNDDQGLVDVPDLAMRQALGGLKTMKSDRSDGYYARLTRAAIRSDERLPGMEDGVPAPVVAPGMRRVTINRHHRWQVDQALVDAFRLREGEIVVSVPMAVLAGARSRFTLTLLLRALAWQTGDVDRHWIFRKRAKATEYKLGLDDLRDLFGVDCSAADIERHALGPAVGEIDHFTDVAIEHQAIAKPGLSSKRARAFIIMVGSTERVTYSFARRPASFSDIGKKTTPSPSGQVIPFTVPFARSTRRVVKDTEDVPF